MRGHGHHFPIDLHGYATAIVTKLIQEIGQSYRFGNCPGLSVYDQSKHSTVPLESERLRLPDSRFCKILGRDLMTNSDTASRYVPGTKTPTLVFPSSQQASRHVALMIESLVRQNNSAGQPTVLGLATGSTPVGLYRELIRRHKEAGLDFSRVITFNLDEYFPMSPTDQQSYRRWMQETFF